MAIKRPVQGMEMDRRQQGRAEMRWRKGIIERKRADGPQFSCGGFPDLIHQHGATQICLWFRAGQKWVAPQQLLELSLYPEETTGSQKCPIGCNRSWISAAASPHGFLGRIRLYDATGWLHQAACFSIIAKLFTRQIIIQKAGVGKKKAGCKTGPAVHIL